VKDVVYVCVLCQEALKRLKYRLYDPQSKWMTAGLARFGQNWTADGMGYLSCYRSTHEHLQKELKDVLLTFRTSFTFLTSLKPG
jgi:hypothetical protein